MWQTIGDDNGNYGHIEVKDCDGTICGFLRKSFDADGKVVKSEHTNKAIVWDMVNKGKGNTAVEKYGPQIAIKRMTLSWN